ncbi:type VI secretion system baseplate subunit TssE [Roseateles sp. BYS87W]|uniref:Type VI secretion system baseplate subunit TssE n=1 Tax=Pelomonas baiyunensis TaxID=3299026 RepID=A0ABW7H570_9BURK
MANTYAPSLLDKLLGDAAEGARGVLPRYSLERIKDSVARDAEHVLNSHASFSPEDLAAYPRASRSLLCLGLLDITPLSMSSDRDRQRISHSIRTALMQHDRRLRDVEVGVRNDPRGQGGLSFAIRAKLLLHPDTDTVVFDALLHPGSQRYEVTQADPRAALQGATPLTAA